MLVRYAEMGLKSPGVRRYFEKVLTHNMMAALARERVEAFVESQYGRLFVTTDRPEEAATVLRRVFGVSSLSHVRECTSEVNDIRRLALQVATPLLKDGSTFRVEARRNGVHQYTSMQLAAQAGEEIFEANKHRGVRVDLHRPDLIVYVEVRDRRAYVFSEYMDGPGGLPMGSQGKVVALIRNERDALAAWMMMKRGCRVLFIAESEQAMRTLERWDPEPRKVQGPPRKAVQANRALGLVVGWSLEDLQPDEALKADVPVYHPLIGMGNEEVERRLKEIEG